MAWNTNENERNSRMRINFTTLGGMNLIYLIGVLNCTNILRIYEGDQHENCGGIWKCPGIHTTIQPTACAGELRRYRHELKLFYLYIAWKGYPHVRCFMLYSSVHAEGWHANTCLGHGIEIVVGSGSWPRG